MTDTDDLARRKRAEIDAARRRQPDLVPPADRPAPAAPVAYATPQPATAPPRPLERLGVHELVSVGFRLGIGIFFAFVLCTVAVSAALYFLLWAFGVAVLRR
jgi:hypothetical protein